MKAFEKVTCGICGHKAHILAPHITSEHKMTLDEYSKQHGPFISDLAKKKLLEMEAEANNEKISDTIKAIFNTQIGTRKIKTWAWKSPHKTTPRIIPSYIFRPELVSLIVAVHENQDERLLFSGPTGSGKSSIIEQAAARLNVPFYRVNLDNQVTKADFVGQYVLKGDETVYQYGTLPLAMKEGAWLLVDEWDMGNPGVTAVLQAVLEGKPLQLADTGEIVRPAEGFRIFATGNTIGQGDETGLYSGTQVQNFAQLDRFTLVEYVDYPKPEVERKIIQKQCGITNSALKEQFGVSEISKENDATTIVKNIVDVANLVRNAFLKEDITTTMSTRTLINIGNKLLMFGDVKRAYNVAYMNKLTPDDREAVAELTQRQWAVNFQ